ncbi:hypothetical protein BDR05DRAFT_974125 [Suillus weaverae]|nr:hypothetical protein BDR05DRAFT_974125 [Suillus weaverae]
MSLDIQMFRHGFFPASFNKPKTMFTFRALDNFLLDNLECSTLAMNYYSKLWRMTSNMFLHLVLLMRVTQQWRKLKTMKWHGFGHHSDNLNAGDLALFCLTCPQHGINISFWKYTSSFPFNEVWLSNGLGFMVGKDRYKKHLAEAADTVEKSSCNNHQAVNQANAAQHKLESTGIRGVAYFQKGERRAEHAI